MYGIDYKEIYAPVSKHTTLRYLLCAAVHRNMEVHQIGVSTAFHHGHLGNKVIVQQPEPFPCKGSQCGMQASQGFV